MVLIYIVNFSRFGIFDKEKSGSPVFFVVNGVVPFAGNRHSIHAFSDKTKNVIENTRFSLHLIIRTN
jgi:hypothetical protein